MSWLLLAVLLPVALVAAYLLVEGAGQQDLLDRKYWPAYAIGAGMVVLSLVVGLIWLLRSGAGTERETESRLPGRRSGPSENHQPQHRA
jgi:hypothetical protein